MAQERRDDNEIPRVNYFQGMMLVDKDFRDEQRYHLRMRYKHNLELHTWGVVRGLTVAIESGKVRVGEGLAIDAEGREIWYRGEPQPGDAPAGDNYLVIEYKEELRDTYPQMADQHLRLVDTAKFSWKSARGEKDVVLARLSQGALDNSLRRNARSVSATDNSVEISPVTKDGSLRLMTGAPPAERLTILPSGGVGIGVASPRSRLDVNGSVWAKGNWADNQGAALTLEGNKPTIRFIGDSESGSREWLIHASANGPGNLDFFERTRTERTEPIMSISPLGRVGIGKKEPGAPLHIKGNAGILNMEGADHCYIQWYPLGLDSGRKGWIGYRSPGEKDLTIQSEEPGAAIILRSNQGKVLIETSPPRTKAALQVGQTPANTKGGHETGPTFFRNVPALFICDPNNGGGPQGGQQTVMVLGRDGAPSVSYANFARFDLGMYEGTGSKSQLDIRLSHNALDSELDNTPTIMSLRSNGNVGIGTTNPGSSRLKIANAATDFVDVRFLDPGTGQLEIIGWVKGWNINAKTSGKHLYLNRDVGESSDVFIGRNGKEVIVTGKDGYVGIATAAPGYALQIGDTEKLGSPKLCVAGRGSTGNHQKWSLRTGDGDNAGDIHKLRIRDETVNADRFVIDESGYVGIGTTAPVRDLHIRRDLAGGVGPTLLIHNSGGNTGAEARIEMATYNFQNKAPNFRLQVIDDGNHGAHVSLNTKISGSIDHELLSRLYIKSDGKVGINTTSPEGYLEIKGSSDDAKVKFGGRGGDAHHLSSARDLVFNSAVGNYVFRKLNTSYGELSDFTNLMTLNSSGDLWVKNKISSPMWRVSRPIHTTGPLPRSGTFSTGGGTLMVFASGSGFKSSVGTLGLDIYIDGTAKDGLRKWTNVVSAHSTFVGFPLVVTGIAAGEHTIEFRAFECTTDSNDYYYATILELPF